MCFRPSLSLLKIYHFTKTMVIMRILYLMEIDDEHLPTLMLNDTLSWWKTLIWAKTEFVLTLFTSMFYFYTPWKRRKPPVANANSQKVSKATVGRYFWTKLFLHFSNILKNSAKPQESPWKIPVKELRHCLFFRLPFWNYACRINFSC